RQLGGRGAGPGQTQAPSAIALDAAGNLYIADEGNGRIARIAADGTPLPSIGTFTDITSIAVTPDGSRIYGADASTNRVTVLDPNGQQIGEYGGQGKAGRHFLTRGAIALDPPGHVWAAERGGNRIQEPNPAPGKSMALSAQREPDPGQFVHPNGIGIGCDGLLTVSDPGPNRVQTSHLAAPPVITA